MMRMRYAGNFNASRQLWRRLAAPATDDIVGDVAARVHVHTAPFIFEMT